MRIHHLDCCTMCPAAGRLVNDAGRLVSHVLAIETPRDGLVLVDTGIGLDDCAAPRARLGRPFVALTGLQVDPARTARRQIEALGFGRDDVRHVVVTHLDLDHAGGLPDFPSATVHVHRDEHHAAVVARAFRDRGRYRACHFAHGPRFAPYDALAAEPWFGLPRARPLEGLHAEIVAIPLPGHSRGHVAVAVPRGPEGWFVHAGDAYFHEGVVDRSRPSPPIGIRTFESLVAWDRALMRQNQERLRALHGERAIELVSAHDPNELARAQASAVTRDARA
jgi:glyoxylase-like metal-dependent hydrolase (beta-lactamase superfamily II)